MNKKILLYFIAAFALVSIAVSCNSDSSSDTSTSASNVAITSFTINEDDDVIENLDSVFFTIDLDRGLIYNADSLPVGTDVSALTVTVGYSSAYSIDFNVSGGTKMANDTTFSYSTSDSIDFTGTVKLIIVAADAVTKKTYDVKVNVHKIEPDSLYWDEMARQDLPSIYGSVTNQRSVKFNDAAYCLMVDAGKYVLATIDNPYNTDWTKSEVTFPFNPDVRSLTATNNALYMLDADNGTLYTSTDFSTWTSCGVTWKCISGAYLGTLLGVTEVDGTLMHTVYPELSGFTSYAIEDGFPIEMTSQMQTFTTKWNTTPVGLIIGGKDASGNVIGHTWGFDGKSWGQISNRGIVPHAGMVLFPYFTYDTDTDWAVTEYSTWFAFGGYLADGTVNQTVYFSRDNGVNWERGDTIIQFPSYVDSMACSDALLFDYEMTVSTRSNNNGWTYMPLPTLPLWYRMAIARNSVYTRTSEAITKWDCPYIYLFGGYYESGALSPYIWRGVINRLTFEPLY